MENKSLSSIERELVVQYLVDGNIPVTLTVGPFNFNNMFAIGAGTIALLGLLSLIYSIFVGNVLEIGDYHFFIKNRQEENVSFKEVLYPFKSEYYMHFVLAQLEIVFRIFLWTLLLIVPGIIKGLGWSQTTYILKEKPDRTCKECMKMSVKCMC